MKGEYLSIETTEKMAKLEKIIKEVRNEAFNQLKLLNSCKVDYVIGALEEIIRITDKENE